MSAPLLDVASAAPVDDPPRYAVWLAYLQSHVAAGRLHAKNVRALWERLRRTQVHGLGVPDAALNEDACLVIWWDSTTYHIEMEFRADGKFEWFWRNRITDAFGGSDGAAVAEPPSVLLEQLRLLVQDMAKQEAR